MTLNRALRPLDGLRRSERLAAVALLTCCEPMRSEGHRKRFRALRALAQVALDDQDADIREVARRALVNVRGAAA